MQSSSHIQHKHDITNLFLVVEINKSGRASVSMIKVVSAVMRCLRQFVIIKVLNV